MMNSYSPAIMHCTVFSLCHYWVTDA